MSNVVTDFTGPWTVIMREYCRPKFRRNKSMTLANSKNIRCAVAFVRKLQKYSLRVKRGNKMQSIPVRGPVQSVTDGNHLH
jgi:hypothetical protein